MSNTVVFPKINDVNVQSKQNKNLDFLTLLKFQQSGRRNSSNNMENADRANANEAVEADEVGVAEPEPEQHRDDEIDSSEEEEDEDDDEEEEEEEPDVTPEEVELEYTFPQDFQGRSWQDVVQRRYCRLIIDPACIDIPHDKFRHCEYLIEIVYPEGTESQLLRIGSWAFFDCCNLQRMNPLPDGLVELGACAFFNCLKLQGRITIPPCIRYVRNSCFEGCRSITSVVFESSTATTIVLELEYYIFKYCQKLRFVRLPNNLTVIPEGCFYGCCSLTDVPIPETVRTIQLCAFKNCAALNAVDFPRNVNLLQSFAYSGCTSLTTVAIRSSSPNLRVGNCVFYNCPSLETMKVYPWIFPKLLHAVDFYFEVGHPNLMYTFYRKYEHQIALYRQQQQQQQQQKS